MHITSTQYRRRPRGVTLLVALAFVALGFTALATTAHAAFTLNSGTLALTDGDASGATNPPTGSWVELPTDDPEATPPFFDNPSSSWEGGSGQYTIIRNANSDESSTGLELGSTQSGSGEIFGDTTDDFAFAPFYAITTTAPDLTFEGSSSETGTRALESGDLSGLDIEYEGNTYTVGTTTASGGDHTVPLHGHIIGAVGGSPPATITLEWTTDLTAPEAGNFAPFKAHFHWEGTYIP
jgi:hypothetical protein